MADLLGRRTERGAIESLLRRASGGRSGTLVVRGEGGIGKTALLQHTRDTAAASGFRVESSVGVESEGQFAFAGLHQLCAPLLGSAQALPEPQRSALAVAFGQRDGTTPDRFLVGLAILNLLAEAADEQPLLCLVDDAQWLDEVSAQVLAFMARRLSAERLVLIFGRRDQVGQEQGDHLRGLPELRLEPLGDQDARALLTSAVHGPLDSGVRDRIIAEARGNPLALLEFPRGVRSMTMAGGFNLPNAWSVPANVEEAYRLRWGALPSDAQLILLVAAADPTGRTDLLTKAADQLGLDLRAVAPAEVAGLLQVDTTVRFCHPLARSAIYHGASAPDRRKAHAALAAATSRETDPDRRAWHRARAVRTADEEVAAELESSASRARARGGLAAAAAFLERATELTPDPTTRAVRALGAACAKHDAGAYDEALALLATAAEGPLSPLQQARVALMRAQIAFHTTRGTDVPGKLLDSALTLEPLDVALARETHLQALQASFHVGRLDGGRWLAKCAKAARQAPGPLQPGRAADLMLDGLAIRFAEGFVASVPTVQRALAVVLDRGVDAVADRDERWLWLACHIAATLWDDEAVYVLAERDVRLARRAGALAGFPGALNALSSVLVLTGETARASELVVEEQAITAATGVPPLPNARLILAAWQGRKAETLEVSEAMVREAVGRGEGATIGLAQVALAALHNGLGNYTEAMLVAAETVGHDELTYSSIALPELIEAAARAGDPGQAMAAMETLSLRAQASGTPWALGLAARGRALLATGDDPDTYYQESIQHLSSTRMSSHLGRSQLLYGEWLRRHGRRQEAKVQLHDAHELLAAMGADAFARRAARELRAAGEYARQRGSRPVDALTSHEAAIARLVATGATSREVAAQMFLSPRTIEAHLRNIFRKLGISSRRQLKDVSLP